MSDTGTPRAAAAHSSGEHPNGDGKRPLFSFPLNPIEQMRSLLDGDESDLYTLSSPELLVRYNRIKNTAKALLVHSIALEEKLSRTSIAIDRLAQGTRDFKSITVESTPPATAVSMEETPELFSVARRGLDPAMASFGHPPRRSLRAHTEHDSGVDSKQVVQHRPYTQLEEIRESISSRSASISSTGSRKSANSGSSVLRGASVKKCAASASTSVTGHSLNTTLAGIPSIASVTKGPYPAHASVITNLYRHRLRHTHARRDTAGGRHHKKTSLNARSPTSLTISISAGAARCGGKWRSARPAPLETILLELNHERASMQSELARMREKLNSVTYLLQNRVDSESSHYKTISPITPGTRVETVRAVVDRACDAAVEDCMYMEANSFGGYQAGSSGTSVGIMRGTYGSETASIDYSAINPVLLAPQKPGASTTKSLSNAIGNSQHSLIIPPRHVTARVQKENALASMSSSLQEMAYDVLQELNSSDGGMDSKLGMSDIHATSGGPGLQSGYLQQIHQTAHHTLQQQQLKEQNKKLKSTLLELKTAFDKGNLESLVRDNEILIARVSELEEKLFVAEASAARNRAEATVEPKVRCCEAQVQTADSLPLLTRSLGAQVDGALQLAYFAAETQTVLTVGDLDLLSTKLLIAEANLKQMKAELIREREKPVQHPVSYTPSCAERGTSPPAPVLCADKQVDTGSTPLSAAHGTPVSTGVQTAAETSHIRADRALDIMAENTSLHEQLRLLRDEMLTTTYDKTRLDERVKKLQEEYDTLYNYSRTQDQMYSQVSEAQLAQVALQQRVLTLEEEQREAATQLKKAAETQQAYSKLTEESWRLSAENEKLTRQNSELREEAKTLKKKMSDTLKEYLDTTVDRRTHQLLEEEAKSLRETLAKLKEDSDRQFKMFYTEKKRLEDVIENMKTHKTDNENTLLGNAIALEKRLHELELESKTRATEAESQQSRAELAEARLEKALQKLHLAKKEGEARQVEMLSLQQHRDRQDMCLAAQQQEMQSTVFVLREEAHTLQIQIQALKEENEKLSAIVVSHKETPAIAAPPLQLSPLSVSSMPMPEMTPAVPPAPPAPKTNDDTYARLIVENAQLRHDLAKQEKQLAVLQSRVDQSALESTMLELERLQQTIGDICVPPTHEGSLASYVHHLEDTCARLNRDLVDLRASCSSTQQQYALVCAQLDQMLQQPDLRVIVRDTNGALLNCTDQFREINEAYGAAMQELTETIRMLSSKDLRLASNPPAHEYIDMRSTLEVQRAHMRARDLEIYRLNQTIADLQRANAEILMLAPSGQ